MKPRLKILPLSTFLALSLASCGLGNNAQSSSEDVIEFRQVLALGSAQATLEAFGQKFSGIDCQNPPNILEEPAAIVGCSRDKEMIYILAPAELDGNSIRRVAPKVDTYADSQWFIEINFDNIGSKKFAELTRRVTSLPAPMNQIAIVASNLVITAPSINEEIASGAAQITGNFSR